MVYTYLIIAAFIFVVSGIVLYAVCSVIDHFLDKKRDMRRMAYIEYLIPILRNEVQDMAVETTKQISSGMFEQLFKGEEAD